MPKDADPTSKQAQGGDVGKGVGKADSQAEDPSSAAGATSARGERPSDAPTEPQSDKGETAGDEPQSGSEDGGSNTIELPELEFDEVRTDRRALERATATAEIAAHPLAGVWEQIEGGDNPDFGPGGYERSVIMLNPGTRVAAVYRVFRGSIVLVMGGELALEVPSLEDRRSEGTLELRVDPSLPSKFPRSRLSLGGAPARHAEPPKGSSPWKLSWKREKQQLVLDGKRYAPSTVDAFEKLRRGGGDVAAPDEIGERAPTRPAQAATAPTGGPKPKEAAFFGVRGGGKRFVFIVDISGSMQGPKLDRMKAELVKSVRALDPDAEFSVVFFSGSASVIDPAWLQASKDKDRAIALIGQQGCEGGTDPTTAFEFAFRSLSPLPDCIFFMTDGLIPPWIPERVRALNSARIPTEIHTIAIGPPQEEPSMKPLLDQIAGENRGSYTFVPQ